MTIQNSTGNVYIGSTNAAATLNLRGGAINLPTNTNILFGPSYATGIPLLKIEHWNNMHAYFTYYENAYFRSNLNINNSALTLFGDGTVGIGFATTYTTGNYPTKGYNLAVNGSFIATSVVVKLVANWPDFVFNNNHIFMQLPEIESYIKTNHHLPDLPGEDEVKIKGIDLGEMQTKLLQKVEELTLLLIEQNKSFTASIDNLKRENEALKAKMESISNK